MSSRTSTFLIIATVLLLIICVVLSAFLGLMFYGMTVQTDQSNASALSNFAAAQATVIRDADDRRVRLFAVAPNDAISTSIDEWDVEVIELEEVRENHWPTTGAYANHHNQAVLTFAAHQWLQGNRELALHLIRTLAEIDPEFVWNHPSMNDLPLQTILGGLKADDGSMDAYLANEQRQWEWTSKRYGSAEDETGE